MGMAPVFSFPRSSGEDCIGYGHHRAGVWKGPVNVGGMAHSGVAGALRGARGTESAGRQARVLGSAASFGRSGEIPVVLDTHQSEEFVEVLLI